MEEILGSMKEIPWIQKRSYKAPKKGPFKGCCVGFCKRLSWHLFELLPKELEENFRHVGLVISARLPSQASRPKDPELQCTWTAE